ncbi:MULTISPECIES: hypothetical protein [unclassified Cyanobium]|uniref:hypothetical protein n=1 Tax=unclassified Cyanobium TaxID=2627006 RepID=UPI0020CCFA02|nr:MULTISPECIES: hypothetical protein [unclassified Cyanobium]MCP9834951.1 hypothetical protein [Cyanobium sp. La Preciosa 7G6]MCP9937714.1 hypothetical protein [Cyanobium sp. Aljojuca 7A6]
MILFGSLGLLASSTFFNPPSPAKAGKEKLTEQRTLCEDLLKEKLLFPESHIMTSGFSETDDDGAQRTIRWTFSSLQKNGEIGKGSAICKANNHLQIANIDVKRID